MPGFCVPADYTPAALDRLAEGNSVRDYPVIEMYGSLRSAQFGSGRRFHDLPDADLATFSVYLQHCRQWGIDFNYTLNFSCLASREFTAEGQRELRQFFATLLDAGVSRFTVALPTIIALLGRLCPATPVTVSVIAGVDSRKKAEFYCNYPNVKAIYLHEALNRNPQLLREIAQLCHDRGVQVGTIVNCSCLLDCALRTFHYNFESHAVYGSEHLVAAYYGAICSIAKYEHTENFLRAPWIRPEELERYVSLEWIA